MIAKYLVEKWKERKGLTITQRQMLFTGLLSFLIFWFVAFYTFPTIVAANISSVSFDDTKKHGDNGIRLMQWKKSLSILSLGSMNDEFSSFKCLTDSIQNFELHKGCTEEDKMLDNESCKLVTSSFNKAKNRSQARELVEVQINCRKDLIEGSFYLLFKIWLFIIVALMMLTFFMKDRSTE